MTKDIELENKGKTRTTTLPFELDRQVIEICKKRGYTSISEFLREATRELVLKYNKIDSGEQIWNIIGGPILTSLSEEFNKNTAQLKDKMKEIELEFDNIKKEPSLSKSDNIENNTSDFSY